MNLLIIGIAKTLLVFNLKIENNNYNTNYVMEFPCCNIFSHHITNMFSNNYQKILDHLFTDVLNNHYFEIKKEINIKNEIIRIDVQILKLVEELINDNCDLDFEIKKKIIKCFDKKNEFRYKSEDYIYYESIKRFYTIFSYINQETFVNQLSNFIDLSDVLELIEQPELKNLSFPIINL